MCWKHATLVVVIAGIIIIFPVLSVLQLESGDETRTAGIAAEMFIRGNYLIPHLNGTVFLEYPPLFYWSASLCYAIFGVTDFAAKLPSALSAFGSGLLVFAFARKMKYPPWAALLSSIMLITSAQFFGNSRKCTVDMMLAFCILLAVYGFYGLCIESNRRKILVGFGLFVVGLTGGIYTKGLLGISIPIAVLGGWLVAEDLIRLKVSWRKYAVLAFGILLSLGAAAVWYFLILRSGGQQMFHTAFWVNNLGRFNGSQGDHVESFFYYFIKLPTLFLPWLLLLPFAIWQNGKRVWRFHDRDALLLLCFLLIPFAALCSASSKRIVYLLPLYAPCALLCGRFLSNLSSQLRTSVVEIPQKYPNLFSSRNWKYGCLILIVCFISADIGYGIYSNRKNSLRPLFEACVELEKSGKTIVLENAAERTRGAAFFYLHHHLQEKDQSITATPEEYRIVQSKKRDLPGRRFADHHYLLQSSISK